MPSILLAGPAVEPITLSEAKQFLRLEHNDDDGIITALIAGSRVVLGLHYPSDVLAAAAIGAALAQLGMSVG